MKNGVKTEFDGLKAYTNTAARNYADQFKEKSLQVKMQTKKRVKGNSEYNKIYGCTDISITDANSEKLKQYRIFMFKSKISKKQKIKKYNYDLLNEFLNVLLYKNEFALFCFLFSHFNRVRKIPKKDNSMRNFIIFFIVLMIAALIAGIIIGHQKDIYFRRI